MRSSAMRLRFPAVNGAVAQAKNCAIASCSGVRVSEIVRTSASAARNALEPNAGGGGTRSWLGEVRKNGRVPWRERTIGAPLETQKPGPTGGFPVGTTRHLSLAANAT